MHFTRRVVLAAALALSCTTGCGGADPGSAGSSTAPPRRIVSISATATEDLFAVGAGKQVVAVDQFSTYPPEAPRTKLSYIDPNAEAIAAYKPDLVVLSLESNKVVPALRRLRIPVLVQGPARSLADAYSQIQRLGAATGHPERAARVVGRMKAEVEAVLGRLGSKARGLTVYHELDSHYSSASSKTFIGRIDKLVGLRNIADRADRAGAYPKLSAEYVVDANPDLIVLADTICCDQDLASLRKRPGLREVDAVRAGDVLAVSDDLASRWGPRIVDYLDMVARAVERLRRGR
jgi:ABC-type Fe3+-hydroxamate transport system substrate-binding protein